MKSIKTIYKLLTPIAGFGFRTSRTMGDRSNDLSKFLYLVHNHAFILLLGVSILLLIDVLFLNKNLFDNAFNYLDYNLSQRPYVYKLFSAAFVLIPFIAFPSAILFRKFVGVSINFLGAKSGAGAFKFFIKLSSALLLTAFMILVSLVVMFGCYLLSIRFPTSLRVPEISIFLPIQIYIIIETFSMLSTLLTSMIINFLPRNK